MHTDRRNMSVRVVSRHSPDASESRVGGTASERVALVGVLSADLWSRTQQPLPMYERGTMPARVAPRQTNGR